MVLRDGVVAAATALVLLALSLLPLLTPWAMHAALDIAESAAWLGADTAMAQTLSDQTVAELLLGPGTFLIAGVDGGPFYDATEIGHLQDVRDLLWLVFLAAGLGLLGIVVMLARSTQPGRIVRAIGIGGALTAVTVAVIGLIGLVAFDPLFELFHQVFFPQGDWAFDPSTQHIVQLYPLLFWQVMSAALGLVAFVLGIVTWLVARLVRGQG